MLNDKTTLAMVEDILKNTTMPLGWRHLVLIEMATEGSLPEPSEGALKLLHYAVTSGAYQCELPLTAYEILREKEAFHRERLSPASAKDCLYAA